MRRILGIFLVWGLLLGGCTSPRPEVRLEPLPPLPFRVALEFSSALPDPYYVLSGPSDTYRRFPFNGWTRSALSSRLAARSGTETPEVTVVVQLVSLQTSYREMGSGPGPGAPLYSGIPGRSLLAGDDFDGGDGRHIPTEIHKSAQLTAELSLRQGGRTLVRKTLTPEAMATVYWENFDAWSYDYGDVLKQVITRLVKDIEAVLSDVSNP
jgi:hypothetical protein